MSRLRTEIMLMKCRLNRHDADDNSGVFLIGGNLECSLSSDLRKAGHFVPTVHSSQMRIWLGTRWP